METNRLFRTGTRGAFLKNLLLWSGKYSFGRLFFFEETLRKNYLKIPNLKLSPVSGVLVKEVIKEVGPCLWFC